MSKDEKVKDAEKTLQSAGVMQKRGRGRPKGSRSKGSFKDKASAKAMFLAGYPEEEIANSLKLPKPDLIKSWAKKGGWIEEREKVQERIATDKLGMILRDEMKTFDELHDMRDKAYEAIKNADVEPTRFSEAVNAYLSALDLEFKLKTNVLQISFLNGVANILREEIQDKALLQRIAARCMEFFQKSSQQNVTGYLKSGDKS